jgi:glycyl-radical enzyme activating protein
MTGRIFDIQRFSIHDGPGIRTTVFLKGCPLRCKWCHNPEGISPKPQLSLVPDKCIACGSCMPVCPQGALVKAGGGKAAVDWTRCDSCGKCAPECAPQALQIVGRETSVEAVLDVVLRDQAYYATSGGGMTISGGEPLFQPDFAEALLSGAKKAGVHTCVETAGHVEWKTFERVAPVTDLFLFDYKETDPQLHEGFTGQRNDVILRNLRALHAGGANILVRCPMIPEYNARKEHLEGIARIAAELPRIKGVELLPYHRLGRGKLNRFGLISRMPDSVKPPDPSVATEWIAFLRKRGVRVVN